MTPTAGLCSLLSIVTMYGFQVVHGSRCYDAAAEENITYARVCSDDRVTSHQIVLDTFEAEATGKTTCLCQVYKEGAANYIQFLNIQGFGNGSTPNVPDCGSFLKLRSNNEHVINCSTFPSIPTYVAPMDIVWTTMFAGDSKYCIEIKSTIPSDAIITVSCSTDDISTTASPPPCVTAPGNDGEREDISTAPTDVQGQCLSVESVVLTIVFGYLLAAVLTIAAVMYFRRKNIQLENKLRTNGDECDTVSTVPTTLTSVALRSAAPTPVSEPLTEIVHLYDDPDPTRNDDRDSKRSYDLESKNNEDRDSKRYEDPTICDDPNRYGDSNSTKCDAGYLHAVY